MESSKIKAYNSVAFWHKGRESIDKKRDSYETSGIRTWIPNEDSAELIHYALEMDGKVSDPLLVRIPTTVCDNGDKGLIDVLFQFDDSGRLHGYVSPKKIEEKKEKTNLD